MNHFGKCSNCLTFPCLFFSISEQFYEWIINKWLSDSLHIILSTNMIQYFCDFYKFPAMIFWIWNIQMQMWCIKTITIYSGLYTKELHINFTKKCLGKKLHIVLNRHDIWINSENVFLFIEGKEEIFYFWSWKILFICTCTFKKIWVRILSSSYI